MTPRLLFSLLVLPVLTSAADVCSNNKLICAPHGFCKKTEHSNEWICDCSPDYTGADCSIPLKTCPDGRTCYNGSECVRNNVPNPQTGTFGYHCDCTKAYGQSEYAGEQCEHSITVVCERDRDKDVYPLAFCTNGGTCVDNVNPGEPHPGCVCKNEDFWGSHCQYRKGEYPSDEAAYNAAQSSAAGNGSGGGDDKLDGIVIFVIVIVCVAFVAAVGFMIYKVRRNRHGDRTSDRTMGMGPAVASDDLDGPAIKMDDVAGDANNESSFGYPGNMHDKTDEGEMI